MRSRSGFYRLCGQAWIVGMMLPYYTKSFSGKAVFGVLRKAIRCQTTDFSCHRHVTRYVCLSASDKVLPAKSRVFRSLGSAIGCLNRPTYGLGQYRQVLSDRFWPIAEVAGCPSRVVSCPRNIGTSIHIKWILHTKDYYSHCCYIKLMTLSAHPSIFSLNTCNSLNPFG